ncbi:MAG TPA: type IV pilus twitching motility protein PilT [Candidatus Cloacimonadota bacterium]|nr:type IV pilus twitching motility protein PilT [Candidatus Cloacimonadota bacterium]
MELYDSLKERLPAGLTGPDYCHVVEKWLDADADRALEVRNTLSKWILSMKELMASDIDFGAPGSMNKVWYRIFGVKKAWDEYGTLETHESTAIILSWLSSSNRQALYMNRSVDFSLDLSHERASSRFRGTVYFERGHLSCNFRRINDTLYTLEGLGIPKPVADKLNLKHQKSGLVLVTGITGSGKSTTLDAIIDINNRENEAHIVIIGHPIEHIHKSKLCLVRHREVGPDVRSFEAGAIEALRQDPDIIVVGEMRDPRTIATVLEITDSGHKAFTTLHTSSAIDSLHRIVAEFPADEQERIRNRLADVLTVSISQKLVPTIDKKLVLAKEILVVDSSVQAAIRNKNIGEIYQMMVEGRKQGMFTLEQDLLELTRKRKITPNTAVNYSNNKIRMIQLVNTL